MKHKVAELQGVLLDRAVAAAAGVEVGLWGDSPYLAGVAGEGQGGSNVATWAPSKDWSQGGPIIEREQISMTYQKPILGVPVWGDGWVAWIVKPPEKLFGTGLDRWTGFGLTPLEAAMHAFVESKLGAEVELP